MIIIKRKNHRYTFDYKVSLIIAPIFLYIAIYTFVVLPSNKEYTDYGTVVAIYKNPYKTNGDTLFHASVIFRDDNNVEYDRINPQKYKEGNIYKFSRERNVNSSGLVASFIGIMIGTLWTFITVYYFIEFLVKTYKIEFINRKKYKLIKELDPYGEEDWSK